MLLASVDEALVVMLALQNCPVVRELGRAATAADLVSMEDHLSAAAEVRLDVSVKKALVMSSPAAQQAVVPHLVYSAHSAEDLCSFQVVAVDHSLLPL